MKPFRKTLAVILAFVIMISAAPMVFVSETEAATTMTLAQLQAKFPDGKYWNHKSGGSNNPDGYTSTACNHHNGTPPCTHSACQDGGGCCYYGSCPCNSFSNAVQCMGFAYKLGYDAFGSDPRKWSKTTDLSKLKAGDIIRYGGHSIFVTAVNGSTITFGDCNFAGTCKIRWNKTTTKSDVSAKLKHILSAPSTLSNTSSQKYIATDFNATIKNGTYTLKCANTSGKMLNVYDGSNSCKDGTKLTTWSKDGSADQKFYFKHVSGGKYLIYAVCSGASGSVYKKVVDVNVGSNGTVDLGDSFDVWTQKSEWNYCQLFYVVPVGGGKYVIELASKPNAVLATKNSTEAAKNGGAITLRNYESYTTQQWYFYNAAGSAQVDPSIDASTSTKTYYTGTYKVTATDGINVRSGAGTSNTKLDAIAYNTTVSVTKISGNWGQITYDGVTGWICLDYTTYVSPVVSSISVKTLPSKTTYFVGETLNTSGLVLNVNYSNNTTGTVSSGFTCSKTTLSSAGTNSITVTYGGKTTTFNVTVNSINLSSISIKSTPTKTSYYTGETLNTSGLALNLTYNNGTTGTTTSGFTCSPTTLSTAGTQKITVTYGGKTTSFNVNVTQVTLNSVSVKTAPKKTEYFVGNTLDTSGLVLNLTYNNGSTGTASSGFTCSPSTLNTAGKQRITVNYNGKTTYFDVNVSEIKISNISVNSKPSKLNYYVGETLDTRGLVLDLVYSDGSHGSATGGFECTPKTLTKAGTQNITVNYGGKTTSFAVNVSEVTLSSIVIEDMPNVTTYKVGDSLDTSGFVVELRYSNGDTGFAESGFECTPSVLSVAGTQVITVSYGGKTCTFNVFVEEIEEPIEKSYIEIQQPSTVSLSYGDTLILHAKAYNLPEGAQIKWSTNGVGLEITSSGYGDTCYVTSKSNGITTISATIVDENDNPIVDKEETELTAEIVMESKAGFFQKLISFFKNLFGMNRTIVQAIYSVAI